MNKLVAKIVCWFKGHKWSSWNREHYTLRNVRQKTIYSWHTRVCTRCLKQEKTPTIVNTESISPEPPCTLKPVVIPGIHGTVSPRRLQPRRHAAPKPKPKDFKPRSAFEKRLWKPDQKPEEKDD